MPQPQGEENKTGTEFRPMSNWAARRLGGSEVRLTQLCNRKKCDNLSHMQGIRYHVGYVRCLSQTALGNEAR